MITDERYARHFALKGFGAEAQQKLLQASVLVVGAGGLGCPVLQYLAASGVGAIGIVDFDTVSISNLQRQVLFHTEDVGEPKVAIAALRLAKLNPDVKVVPYHMAVGTSNAALLVGQYDLVVDCTDNFATRYLLNDVCVLLDKPLVFGAIFQFEGQVAVFNVATPDGRKVHYRHLFPVPPGAEEVPNCNQAGVLGVLPGAIGVLQATEVIKLITGIGEPLVGKLLTLNLLNYSTYIVELSDYTDTPLSMPSSLEELQALDYAVLCGSAARGVAVLTPEDFPALVYKTDTVVVDVREPDEQPRLPFPNLNIPLATLKERVGDLSDRHIIVLCQSGKRSLTGAGILIEKLGEHRKISHLEGGVNALSRYFHLL